MPSPIGPIDRIAHRIAGWVPHRRVAIAPNRPIVSFTFDDVPVSGMENGTRILEAHEVRGTFFVAGGLAGKSHDGQVMADAAAYRKAAQNGHELGEHTYFHRPPVKAGGGYGAELDRNTAYLDGILPGTRRNFAFPYGLTSVRSRHEVDKRFRSGRGVTGGINRGMVDLGLLLSVSIQPDSDEQALLSWIDDAVAQPGWLIYFTHDVQDEPLPWGCRPHTLERLVERALGRGCEVLTVDAALDRLGVA